MCGQTDGDDECSIAIPLRSAILIASDALITIALCLANAIFDSKCIKAFDKPAARELRP